MSISKTTPATAQTITAASDGTGTTIEQTNSAAQFNITGGSLSDNGDNLFHSFQTFQVNENEQVNFFTTPLVQSVFARVSGSAPSFIDGQLQLLGSEANLFLINPSGIVFGDNATLNLPANFTATTANALRMGNQWFNGTGSNNYAALNAPVDSFAFVNEMPGSIVNGGKLALGASQQLTLVGGSVINTGTLSTPGGAVTIASVPGKQIVRIYNEQNLLSLELETADIETAKLETTDIETANIEAAAIDVKETTTTNTPLFTPRSLPALLANSHSPEVSQLVTNADGTVNLLASQAKISPQPGTTILSGALDVSQPVAASPEGELIGGSAVVLGDRVALLNAQVDASGIDGGGRVLIGGDYQGQGNTYQATHTIVDGESRIAADAIATGNGGEVITWAQDTTRFTGDVTARGGTVTGDGGFVEVSGKAFLSFQGTVDVTAAQGHTGSLLLDPESIQIVNGAGGNNDAQLSDNSILFGDRGTQSSGPFTLSENTLEQLAGNANVTLQAANHILLADLDDGELTFKAGSGNITWIADADQEGTGDIIFSDTQDRVSAAGRSLNFSGNRLILGNLNTVAPEASGDITLQANTTLNTGRLISQSPSGSGGSITLTAKGAIETDVIRSAGRQASGDVALTSYNSNITTGTISTDSFGQQGNITRLPFAATQSFFPESFHSTPVFQELSPQAVSPQAISPPELSSSELSPPEIMSSDIAAESEQSPLASSIQSDSSLPKPQQARGTKPSRNGQAQQARSPSARHRHIQNASRTALNNDSAFSTLQDIEASRVQEFTDYFGRSINTNDITPNEIKALLTTVKQETDLQSVVVYIKTPTEEVFDIDNLNNDNETGIEILLFTAASEPVKLTVPGISQALLQETITDFRNKLATSLRRNSTSYLDPAQALYQWLIAPIENELGKDAIDNILFSMDTGLRSIPIAALHDGEQFLIEKYSVGMVPSLALMNTEYEPIKTAQETAQVLAMGASTFETLQPLSAVPVEIETISQLWQSRKFLNETFTLQNLIQEQSRDPAQIIHLATHAEFKAGNADHSYIQLWNDERLYLSDIHTLGWDSPAIDLLVLSACQTALGSPEAEMGFAGLAVAAGAKSAVASLWSVSDVGTLALMSEFYSHLRTAPTRADALRQAQLAMLNKETRIEAGGLLRGGSRGVVPLPPSVESDRNLDLSHPYYWSGFTMIGNPW